MTKLLSAAAATLLAASLIATAAVAASPKAGAKHAMKMTGATCPFCKMPLGTVKSAKMPVAIKMNGKTYYTCAPCKAKVAAMSAKKPMMMKKTM